MQILLKKENNIKNVDEYIDNYLKQKNLTKDDILINIQDFNKGILNSKRFYVTIVEKRNLIDYVQNFINMITGCLNLETQMKVTFDEEVLNIHIDSNNNAILIGKDARMLNSIQLLLKQSIRSKTDMNVKIYLDISNYKEKHVEKIKSLATKIAKEVIDTKISVKLDSMNSYERRIVHNVINEYENLRTKSEGEEPNRCVVVEYYTK